MIHIRKSTLVSILGFLACFGVCQDCRFGQCAPGETEDCFSLMQSRVAFSKRASAPANYNVPPHDQLLHVGHAGNASKLGQNALHAKTLTQTGSTNPLDSWPFDLKYSKDPPHDGLKFTFYHPVGVVSNVYGGDVVWAKVWLIDLHKFFALTLLAYPVFMIPLSIGGAVIVGMCLRTIDSYSDNGVLFGPPAVSTSQLTPSSLWLYSAWCMFCRCIPSILVFVIPLVLCLSSCFAPQEVYSVMLLVSSTFICANGLYLTLFAPFVVSKLGRYLEMTSADALLDVKADQKHDLIHWVIIPNYCEDEEILMASINSIARSSLARSNICLLLAMEEREENVNLKSGRLSEKSEAMFKEILTSFHPVNLPNDPPGKASNVAYAFRQLTSHLESNGVDQSKIMLTISDADTEFHELYFEVLTREYFQRDIESRRTTIWQSIVLHLKNYHRQPGPVVVGNMFTAMTELSFMADPNGIRLPYSSYSLPCQLATLVGGWDPEWIAEDWHMGLKCFLFTLGRSEVQPIMIPTINYSPEGSSWIGTCYERWLQAKRHSLGFSDISYYFMMLPLMFLYTVSEQNSQKATLADFWHLVLKGLAYLIRLVNSHAVIGYLALYGGLNLIVKAYTQITTQQYADVREFFNRTFWADTAFGCAAAFFTLCATVNFQVMYAMVKDRLEKPSGYWTTLVFSHPLLHWVLTLLSFGLAGPFFFVLLAVTVWAAAGRMLFSINFSYDVAAKPTKEQRTM